MAYFASFNNGFVNLDDDLYVERNQIVQRGLTRDGLRYAWTTYDVGNYIPLTWMSYELEVTMAGAKPWLFHVTNVALHLLNSLLLFQSLHGLTGCAGRSAAVALLFSVHPLHVESVAWISERKDVLSTFFLLLMLLSYDRYRTEPKPLLYFISLLLLIFGLLAKPMLVTVPILLLLVDLYWPRQPGRSIQEWRLLLVEKLPHFGLCFWTGMITILAQNNGKDALIVDLDTLPIKYRFSNAVYAYCCYIGQTLWPIRLSVFYPHTMDSLGWKTILTTGAMLVAISIYVVWFGRQRRYLPFGWYWFLISLLPVIGLLQVGRQSHADRYVYIPHIGLLVLLVWESDYWLSRLFERGRTWLAASVVLLLVAISTILTHWQTQVWHDSEALWRHAVDVNSRDFYSRFQLAQIEYDNKRLHQARILLESSLKVRPDYDASLFQLGEVDEDENRLEEAERHYRLAIKSRPEHPLASVRLAALYLKLGKPKEALSCMQRYLRLDSRNAVAWTRMGMILAEMRDVPEAYKCFAEAQRLVPDSVSTLTNLGMVLYSLRRFSDSAPIWSVRRSLIRRMLDVIQILVG